MNADAHKKTSPHPDGDLRAGFWYLTLGKIPVILMLVTVLTTAAAFHFSWQRAFHRSVFDLTQQLSNRITAEIAYEMGLLLSSASTKVGLLHRLLLDGVVSLTDSKAQEVLFLATLQSNPAFSWVTLGFPSGNFSGAQRQNSEKFRFVERVWNMETRLSKSQDRFFLREGDSLAFTHTVASELRYFAPDRAWYRDAVKSGGRVWTDVYIYASSQKPGIDVAMSLDKNGYIAGVVAVGIELDQISKYLGGVSVGKAGTSFVINRREELIAYPDLSEVVVTENVGGKLKLGRLSHARAPLLRVAAKAIEAWDLSTIRVINNHIEMVDGTEYLVTITPSSHDDWLIGTVIATREFVAEVDAIQNQLVLLVGIAVLLLSTIILIWIRAVLVRPMLAIIGLATKIGQGGEWQAHVTEKSPIVEVNLLTQAMQRMGQDLSALRTKERRHAETRLNQERSLVQLNRDMRESEDIASLCRAALYFLVSGVDAQVGAVYLLEEERCEQLRLYASYAVSREHLPEWLGVQDGWLGSVILEKKLKIFHDIPSNSFIIHAGVFNIMPSTLVAVPFILNEQSHGVLVLGRIQAFTVDHLDFMQRVADAVIVAIVGIRAAVRNRALLSETMHQKDELVRSQNELNKTIEQLNRTSEFKSQFLANMSHEIRTPINAVIGMSYLALRTSLNDQQRDYVGKIHFSANVLLGIINDILDFSKIEAGEMRVESVEFNLDEVLDNLATMVCVKAEEKGLAVLFSRPLEVPNQLLGDPLRLGQVLTNLANNAVKFTERGEIVIRGERLEERAAQIKLRFSVEDSGIGLTQEQTGKLFNPFSQADTSTTRKYGGTGLGLSISKRLVELMGGTIGVESELGKGSVFHFTAWFGLQPLADDEYPSLVADFADLKVLVVDDHARSRQILCDMVNSFCWRCQAVDSGLAALAAIDETLLAEQDKPYQLVIVVWRLSGMSGLELSQRIKRHPKLANPPRIILVTPYSRSEIIFKAERAFLDGFLAKPVNPSQLFSVVMMALGEKKAERRKNRRLDPAQNTEAAKNIVGAKVLLTDDNKINQQVATALLESHGLVVTVASSGMEAVAAAAREHFDIVLMDIQMPEMDGFQATHAIRQQPSGKTVPIIALTAHAMAGDREKSLAGGMNDHITKPIDPDKLFKALLRWIPPMDRGGDASLPIGLQPEGAMSEQELLPEKLPGIDLEIGLKQVVGDRKLFKKLLVEFYQDYQDVVTTIQAAWDHGRHEEAIRLAHTVKGIAGTLGANNLQRCSRDLEVALKDGQSPTHGVLLDQFAQALAEVFQGLATLQTMPAPKAVVAAPLGSSVVLDTEALRPLFQELAQLLYAGHSAAGEKLTAIASHMGHSEQTSTVQHIHALLEDYEFSEALEAFSKLAQALKIPID